MFSTDAAVAPEIKPRRPGKKQIVLQNAEEWLNADGSKYNNLTARNWLHPNRPFPKNPWFNPPAPIGDKVREELYQTYASDPKHWTPRNLALKYNISVIRVEAILRLKHLEKIQSAQGYVLQRKFANSMEKLLDVDGNETARIKEDPTDNAISSRKAQLSFDLADSDVNLEKTKKESQSEKNTIQTEKPNLGFERRSDGHYWFRLSGILEPEEERVRVVEDNPMEKCRHDVIIADLSTFKENNAEGDIYVRETSGVLRTATEEERQIHFDVSPLVTKQKGDLWRP